MLTPGYGNEQSNNLELSSKRFRINRFGVPVTKSINFEFAEAFLYLTPKYMGILLCP